ncbi:hypothetical protein BDV95DRAFT_564076 [Massariosphaeria phaeospora]|uniref:F-box domain-containing protein n=1 Tax=Massariosphaeria phaeospora TaxID=100035 RepID=A0A7C8IAV6_9PLEO|nr:hypothetical protein BDV95DRAFT_564076 [Massariosphaeria phaeospora]
MTSPFQSLPNELLLNTFERLRHDDLAKLMRVCTAFHKLVEPLIWTKIEFHRPNFHEDFVCQELSEEEEAFERPYQQRDPAEALSPIPDDYVIMNIGVETRYNKKVIEFFQSLSTASTNGRFEHLANLIRWICLPIHGEGYLENQPDVWNTLAAFRNLEYLEVSAFWTRYDMPSLIRPSNRMSKLKTIKLRGNIPREFVRHVCQSANSITALQLGVLARQPEPFVSTRARSTLSPSALEELSNSAPPLACLTPSIISKFTSLTCLYLCRPTQAMEKEAGFDRDSENCCNGVENRILREWASVLRATKGTLAHITLDHRIIVAETRRDGMHQRKASNREYMERIRNGPGYSRFVKTVLPVLLEHADWPALKAIRILGFERSPQSGDHSDTVSIHVDRQLEERFPGVRVTSTLGRRMVCGHQYLFEEDD